MPVRAMMVIFNPTAGRRRAHLLWRVLDVLSANGVRLDLAETRHAGHAGVLAREAAASGVRLVVAAGGDGTIAEVVGGLAGSPSRLGIIPLGTANVLAWELGLPFAPHAVASALAFGRTRTLWPGLAHTPDGARVFVQMLGVGLDAQVVHRLSLPLKRAVGRAAYVAQTLREVARYEFAPLRVRLDGHDHAAAGVVVSKGRLYGGRYTLAPTARPGEPGFTVALFSRGGRLPALLYGAALPLNLLPHAPGLRLLRAQHVEILHGDGACDSPAQADGDPAGRTPVSVSDAAGPVEVVTA